MRASARSTSALKLIPARSMYHWVVRGRRDRRTLEHRERGDKMVEGDVAGTYMAAPALVSAYVRIRHRGRNTSVAENSTHDDRRKNGAVVDVALLGASLAN